jgi:hypothetical protein
MFYIEQISSMSHPDRQAARRPRRAAPPPRGQALASLLASDALRDRFYSWRGASGRRHVCSVFHRGEEAIVADFSNGLIVGVACEGAFRRPVCVFSAREFDSGERRSLRETAHELGVIEWHVHFGADGEALRDLASSLLN